MFSQMLDSSEGDVNKKEEQRTIELLDDTRKLLVSEYPSIGAMLGSIANAIKRGDEGFLVTLNSSLGPWSRERNTKKPAEARAPLPMELCGICKCLHPRHPHGMCYGAG